MFLFFIMFPVSFSTAQQKKETDHSSLLLPPIHKHWEIYLQWCIWNIYFAFSIRACVITRPLIDESNYPCKLIFNINYLVFVCFILTIISSWLTNAEFGLPETITIVLKTKQPTKWAGHPRVSYMCWLDIFTQITFEINQSYRKSLSQSANVPIYNKYS